MANNYIEVNTDRLAYDCNNMDELLAKAEKDVTAMFEAVSELNSMWKGRANDAFSKQFSEEYESAKRYLSEIKKFIIRIKNESTAYAVCEEKAVTLANNIRI